MRIVWECWFVYLVAKYFINKYNKNIFRNQPKSRWHHTRATLENPKIDTTQSVLYTELIFGSRESFAIHTVGSNRSHKILNIGVNPAY